MGIRDNYDKKMELSAQTRKLTAEMLELAKKQGEITKQVADSQKYKNIFTTEAGQMALEMDKADGKEDGKISSSVWNAYAEGHEGRTTISEKGSISVFDAMNSITTYMVREEARENGADAKPTEKDDPNIDYD